MTAAARTAHPAVDGSPQASAGAVVTRLLEAFSTVEVVRVADVPEPVAISEAVGLVAELSTDASPTFVNGVLGRLQAVKPTLSAPAED